MFCDECIVKSLIIVAGISLIIGAVSIWNYQNRSRWVQIVVIVAYFLAGAIYLGYSLLGGELRIMAIVLALLSLVVASVHLRILRRILVVSKLTFPPME